MVHASLSEIPDKITSWDDLLCLYRAMSMREERPDEEWIYRGHERESYCLRSSLERTVTGFGICINQMRKIEKKLVHEFQRRLHHYRSDVPAQDDIVAWLALMRHHGAPTRLLDWTYSLFIATFFAPGKPTEDKGVIWALNKNDIKAEDLVTQDMLPKGSKSLEAASTWKKQAWYINHLLRQPEATVCCVNPQRLNERLAIQQGLFVFPGDICQPFGRNINNAEVESKLKKITVEVGLVEKRDFILNLRRMNIDEASLFPGLDGFAESLRTRVAWLHLIEM